MNMESLGNDHTTCVQSNANLFLECANSAGEVGITEHMMKESDEERM